MIIINNYYEKPENKVDNVNINATVSASDKVYDFIMEKIVSKEWQPNSKIMSENQLCTELNVSRISVREALEKLVAFGILEKKQGFGTVVKELKPLIFLKNLVPVITLNEDIKEILEFRILFESANVQLFMKNHDESDVLKLRNNYENMKSSYHDPQEYYLHDFYFHEVIATGTKNPIVISINEILHSILKYNIKQMYHGVGPDNAIYYHKRILEAIENNDTELASLFMKRHLEDALKVAVKNLKS